jgi:hypothetical protein
MAAGDVAQVASIRPMVNSATGTALLAVVRATLMPHSRAAARSKLSTPTPHLCSSFSLRADLSTRALTGTWPEIA